MGSEALDLLVEFLEERRDDLARGLAKMRGFARLCGTGESDLLLDGHGEKQRRQWDWLGGGHCNRLHVFGARGRVD